MRVIDCAYGLVYGGVSEKATATGKSGMFVGLIGSELLCGLSRERSREHRWSVGRKECPVGVPCFDQELTDTR